MSTSLSGISDEARSNAVSVSSEACGERFIAALRASVSEPQPFPYRRLTGALPAEAIQALCDLSLPAPELDGRSGAREIHNDSRRYLDPEMIARSPLCAAVAGAFQSAAVVGAVEKTLGAHLADCHLRIEYAQDTDGFWLSPHTDLGVKRFTLLCYLGPEGRPDLGTDLYAAADQWIARPDFAPGAALAFVPSDRSWHGFEPRALGCVRQSLIVNYVSADWRAREQLAFPDTPAGVLG